MRQTSADKQRTLRIYRYNPYIQPGNKINLYWTQLFRLYQREPIETTTILSPQKVFQLGGGDVTKILVAENVSQAEVDSSTQSICRKDQLGTPYPTRGSLTGKQLLGPYKDPHNGLFQTPVLITHPLMQEANQSSPWNRSPDVLNLVSNASIEFSASEKFVLAEAVQSIKSGRLPVPTAVNVVGEEPIYSFTDFKKNAGVSAGDSGIPVIETNETSVGASELKCVSGVVVREFWSNPFGSAGGLSSNGARRIAGVGAGVEPTTIVHRISSDQQGQWVQVFPVPASGILSAKIIGWTDISNNRVIDYNRSDIMLNATWSIRPSASATLPSAVALPRQKISSDPSYQYVRIFYPKPGIQVRRSFLAIKDVSGLGVTDVELNGCLGLLNSFRNLPVQAKVSCSLDGAALLEFDIMPNSTRGSVF